jgi:hypothetical protein
MGRPFNFSPKTSKIVIFLFDNRIKKSKRIQNNSVIYTVHVLKKKTENRKSLQIFPEIIMVVYLSTLVD